MGGCDDVGVAGIASDAVFSDGLAAGGGKVENRGFLAAALRR